LLTELPAGAYYSLCSVALLLQVARRIFPVGRGLYEDYLANFWCTTSVAIKWKSLLSNAVLMPACAGITVLVALPSMVQQILQPSPRGLVLGMANSAFAFFMFSYQVGAGCWVVRKKQWQQRLTDGAVVSAECCGWR
jgi:hypothetical protein